jgi:hypothetical protein
MSSTQPITATQPFTIDAQWARWTVRAVFLALLGAALLVPQLKNSFWTYPGVPNAWVLLPLCALFMMPLIDFAHPLRLLHLDLLALLAFVPALALWSDSSFLPLMFMYVPLVYLCVRMVIVARPGPRGTKRTSTATPARSALSRRWLIVGLVALAAVHVNWTLTSQENTDVGAASVSGAQKIIDGRPVYGADQAQLKNLGYDPHYDTYGPVVYDSYAPFAAVAGAVTASHLAALFFDILTAALLFALGRKVRGPTAGITLAYCWLAFPFTLYTGELASNDALVAAALVGTLLAAQSPARRGALIALAGWTKLSPLALVPLLAGHELPARGRRAALMSFSIAFALTSALVFVPVLTHSSPSTFVARTLGFQLSRPYAFSIWERLDGNAVVHTATWIATSSRVLHGLLVAVTIGVAIALLRLPRRRDLAGLAAASAALLIALELCDSYYSLTYVLWFAPLVLVALVLGRSQEMTVSDLESALSTSGPDSRTTARSSMRTPREPGRYTPGSTVTTLPT